MILAVILVACGQDVQPENAADAAEEKVELKEKDIIELPEEDKQKKENTNSSTEPLSELKAHYIDVGQADAALLQYADGDEDYTILFDTGDWRGNEVVTYLQSQNVSSIDLIVVSHPDADHIGQLENVVTTFETGEVWLSGNESTSETFQRAMEAVLHSGADYDEPRMGDVYEIGPLQIDVLYPKSISGDSNEESVSLRFTYGDIAFLFTGDADKDAEMAMLQSGIDVEADFLQLGHHGSNTSSHPSFIDAVHPRVAIYSAAEDNSYGHPNPEVVSLIQNRGIDLYGTDVHGTIIVTTDGKDYRIETKDDGTISPKSTETSERKQTQQDDSSSDPPAANGSCVNINDASIEEVQEIIHIGPARAQDLIDLRPFDSVDDLERIKGIGPARIADIKAQGLACVE